MQMVQKLGAASVALLLATGCAAAQTRTILVLDATAQMSAKFGQLRKIDAVKSAVTAAASRMDSKAPLALWAFGTNPSGKCDGKGELVKLQPAGQRRRRNRKGAGYGAAESGARCSLCHFAIRT